MVVCRTFEMLWNRWGYPMWTVYMAVDINRSLVSDWAIGDGLRAVMTYPTGLCYTGGWV